MQLGVFDIPLAQLRQHRIDGLDENAPLHFRNAQSQKLFGVTPVCHTGAFNYPFTVGVIICVPLQASSAKCHNQLLLPWPADPSIGECGSDWITSTGSNRKDRPAFTKGMRWRYTQL